MDFAYPFFLLVYFFANSDLYEKSQKKITII